MKLNKIFDCIYEDEFSLIPFINTGVIIDTKPLLLFLIGVYENRKNIQLLSNFGYNKKDFDYLEKFRQRFRIEKFYTTPQILSETFYFIENKLNGEYKDFLETMMHILINGINEEYFHKDVILNQDSLIKFGFTDVSLVVTCKTSGKLTIITDDSKLSDYCNSLDDKKRLVIDLSNDLRPYFLTMSL